MPHPSRQKNSFRVLHELFHPHHHHHCRSICGSFLPRLTLRGTIRANATCAAIASIIGVSGVPRLTEPIFCFFDRLCQDEAAVGRQLQQGVRVKLDYDGVVRSLGVERGGRGGLGREGESGRVGHSAASTETMFCAQSSGQGSA